MTPSSALRRARATMGPRQRLADDLAAMFRFTRNHPDVDYMAGLLLGLMREGRYDEPRTPPVSIAEIAKAGG